MQLQVETQIYKKDAIKDGIDTAATQATSYITYIDENVGIQVHDQNRINRDFIQINSTAISMVRDTVETLRAENNNIRVGKLGTNKRNVYITDSAIQLRNNTTVLAEYGTDIKFNNPSGNTVATINANGMVLSSGGIKAGTAGQSGFLYISSNNYGTNLTINSHTANNWREVIGTKFGVDEGGTLYATNAVVSGIITASEGSNVYTAAAADDAISSATANLATKGDAVYRTQRIYQRRTAATTLSKNTTWLTSSGTGYNNWSLQIPQLLSGTTKYPFLYTAVQTQTVSQYNNGAGTTCGCSDVLLDNTTTVIDGGSLITGSVTANEIIGNKLSAIYADMGSITAGNITKGYNSINFDNSPATLEFKNASTWASATQGLKYDSSGLAVKGAITATALVVSSGAALTDSSGLIANSAIQIGAKNLLFDSTKDALDSHTTYNICDFNFTEALISGEQYTISAKVVTSSEKKSVAFYHSGGSISMSSFINVNSSGIYTVTFTATANMASQTSGQGFGFCRVYVSNNASAGQGSTTVTGTAHVEWIKIEKGNKATDWSPAPEDADITTDFLSGEITDLTDDLGRTKANLNGVSSTANSLNTYVRGHVVVVPQGLEIRPDATTSQSKLQLTTAGVTLINNSGQSIATFGTNVILGIQSNNHVELSPSELGFYTNRTNKVAYISSNTLNIEYAELKQSLKIGNFTWRTGTNRISLIYTA